MLLEMLLKSYMLGFLAACSVGPMLLLILHRSAQYGRKAGIASALGLALADGIFFAVGMAFGASLAKQSRQVLQVLEKIGAPVLLCMGIYTIWHDSQEADGGGSQEGCSLSWMLFSSLALTLSNPMSLLFFASVSLRLFPNLGGNLLTIYNLLICAAALFAGSLSLLYLVLLSTEYFPGLRSSRVITILRYCSGFGLAMMGVYLWWSVGVSLP